MLQINKLREKYLEDGFIVIKSMYSKEYIRKLRPEIIELANLQIVYIYLRIYSNQEFRKIIWDFYRQIFSRPHLTL